MGRGVGVAVLVGADRARTVKVTANGVQIANFAFGPADLSVGKGTTVTWTNGDAVQHSMIADDLSFQSNPIGKGSTFVNKFGSTGQFAYRCGIHPQMTGTITVTG